MDVQASAQKINQKSPSTDKNELEASLQKSKSGVLVIAVIIAVLSDILFTPIAVFGLLGFLFAPFFVLSTIAGIFKFLSAVICFTMLSGFNRHIVARMRLLLGFFAFFDFLGIGALLPLNTMGVCWMVFKIKKEARRHKEMLALLRQQEQEQARKAALVRRKEVQVKQQVLDMGRSQELAAPPEESPLPQV